MTKSKIFYTLGALSFIFMAVFVFFIQDDPKAKEPEVGFEEIVRTWYTNNLATEISEYKNLKDSEYKYEFVFIEGDSETPDGTGIKIKKGENVLLNKNFEVDVELESLNQAIVDGKYIFLDVTIPKDYECINECIANFNTVGGLWVFDIEKSNFKRIFELRLQSEISGS